MALRRHNDEQIMDCEFAPTRARVHVNSVSWSKQKLDTSLHTLSKSARTVLSTLEDKISGDISV